MTGSCVKVPGESLTLFKVWSVQIPDEDSHDRGRCTITILCNAFIAYDVPRDLEYVKDSRIPGPSSMTCVTNGVIKYAAAVLCSGR